MEEGTLGIIIQDVPGETLYKRLQSLLDALNSGKPVVITVLVDGQVEDVELRVNEIQQGFAVPLCGSITGSPEPGTFETLHAQGVLGVTEP